jgi:hypothetical protein
MEADGGGPVYLDPFIVGGGGLRGGGMPLGEALGSFAFTPPAVGAGGVAANALGNANIGRRVAEAIDDDSIYARIYNEELARRNENRQGKGELPIGASDRSELDQLADWALRQTNTELDNMDIDAARAARDKAIQQAQSRSSIPLVIPLPVSPGVAAGLTIAGAILGGGLGGGGSTSSPSTGTQTTTGTEPETTGTGGQVATPSGGAAGGATPSTGGTTGTATNRPPNAIEQANQNAADRDLLIGILGGPSAAANQGVPAVDMPPNQNPGPGMEWKKNPNTGQWIIVPIGTNIQTGTPSGGATGTGNGGDGTPSGGGGVGVIAVSSTKTVTVCANKKTNVLRYAKNGKCVKNKETKVVLNRTGVAGTAGATGAVSLRDAKGYVIFTNAAVTADTMFHPRVPIQTQAGAAVTGTGQWDRVYVDGEPLTFTVLESGAASTYIVTVRVSR